MTQITPVFSAHIFWPNKRLHTHCSVSILSLKCLSSHTVAPPSTSHLLIHDFTSLSEGTFDFFLLLSDRHFIDCFNNTFCILHKHPFTLTVSVSSLLPQNIQFCALPRVLLCNVVSLLKACEWSIATRD